MPLHSAQRLYVGLTRFLDLPHRFQIFLLARREIRKDRVPGRKRGQRVYILRGDKVPHLGICDSRNTVDGRCDGAESQVQFCRFERRLRRRDRSFSRFHLRLVRQIRLSRVVQFLLTDGAVFCQGRLAVDVLLRLHLVRLGACQITLGLFEPPIA